MKKLYVFGIFIFICAIMILAVAFVSGCSSGIFNSEIAPSAEPPRVYQKVDILAYPDSPLIANICPQLEIRIPAGGVSRKVNISVVPAPPPFSSNGSISYCGDVFTIENFNEIKSFSFSFKIPENKQGGFERELRMLYFFPGDRRYGLIKPEISNGRALVLTGNAADQKSKFYKSCFSSGRLKAGLAAAENEKSEMIFCLVSIECAIKFEAPRFNLYADSAMISHDDLVFLNDELEASLNFAGACAIKVPAFADKKIDVYITKLAGIEGRPANENIGLPVSGDRFESDCGIFLSSRSADFEKIKLYRMASREFFKICQGEYIDFAAKKTSLSDIGWGWFSGAASAWFSSMRMSDADVMNSFYDSRGVFSSKLDPCVRFTEDPDGSSLWYFLWLASKKYGPSKIHEALVAASSMQPFYSSKIFSREDFESYFNFLLEKNYEKILNSARIATLPCKIKLRPLEACALAFDIRGKKLSITKLRQGDARIYARLRSESSSSPISRSVIFRNSPYCEITDSCDVDSNVFDRVYVAAMNSEISDSKSEAEMVFIEQSNTTAGELPLIFPIDAEFDKNPSKRSNVNIVMAGHYLSRLVSISCGKYILLIGLDYNMSDNGIAIASDYMSTLANGENRLNFDFGRGEEAFLKLKVTDSSPALPPARPIYISFDPCPIVLAHSSRYDLSVVEVGVTYDNGSRKPASGTLVWKVIRGEGYIKNNVYFPVNEDSERLECSYTEKGFNPVYNYLDVIYSDEKLVAAFIVSPLKASAGQQFSFDASASSGCDMYEWHFDSAGLCGESDLSVKSWSRDPFAVYTYSAGGIYKVVLKVKNSKNQNYMKSSQGFIVSVKPAPPVISPPGGNFSGECAIALNAGLETSRIIYTLDGGDPSPFNGIVYKSPFKIYADAKVRAVAIIDEKENAPAIFSDFAEADYKSIRDSLISPSAASVDTGIYKADLRIEIFLNGNSLRSIKNGEYELKPVLDYAFNEEEVIFKKEYLATLVAGDFKLVFEFSSGEDCVLALNVRKTLFIIETVTVPVFSPPGGVYASDQSVMILTSTKNATVKYTLDGSNPSRTNGYEYKSSISVAANATLKAFAYRDGMIDSAVALAYYEILPPVPDPVIEPSGGSYSTLSVTITCATKDAIIKYTLDGSDPSGASGIEYGGPIEISHNVTLKAVAMKTGLRNSSVVSASYEIIEATAVPMFSPSGGTYADAQSVAISTSTKNATIKYTLDGSEPSRTNGIEYKKPVNIVTNAMLKAIAYKTGTIDSAVASAYYEILPPVPDPVIEPSGGSYSTLSVTITCATKDAIIKYTLDGSDPSGASGIEYGGPIEISHNVTLKAVAMKTGLRNSSVVSASYEIIEIVAVPVFSPSGGVYASDQSVAISTSTKNAIIKYTIDGSEPSAANGIEYKKPVGIVANSMLKAFAYKTGMIDSAVASAYYEILPPVPDPVIEPSGGSYSTLSVTITCATKDAIIKYTLDGSDPSEANGIEYGGPIEILLNVTLKAIAIKTGLRSSSIVSASYEIVSPVAPPAFSPPGGSYNEAQKITMSTVTKGATIKYTLDGSDPSETNGIEYKKAVTIGESRTLKAYAYKSGMPGSEIVTARYEINP